MNAKSLKLKRFFFLILRSYELSQVACNKNELQNVHISFSAHNECLSRISFIMYAQSRVLLEATKRKSHAQDNQNRIRLPIPRGWGGGGGGGGEMNLSFDNNSIFF